MQTQHTCILLEDITASCNLTCPTCFAESSPQLTGTVPAERVLANIDERLSRENGRIDVLMLSGGEPTLHPEFERIVEGVLERDVVRVLVNSNGIRLAKDDAFLRFFERHNHRIEVYLQFDGFRLETHRAHRGADLRRIKSDAWCYAILDLNHGVSLPKSRFARIDGAARQGSDAQQCLRTAQSGACRARDRGLVQPQKFNDN